MAKKFGCADCGSSRVTDVAFVESLIGKSWEEHFKDGDVE